MKNILTALAITSSLIFTTGCAKEGQSSQTDTYNGNTVANANPHEGHNMGDGKTHKMGEDYIEGHSQLQPANAVTKLTLPTKITPKTPVNLVIDIQDKQGKPIANFDQFQEQLMHLIVVSDNLAYFNHIHPTYKENGRFEIQTNFPSYGGYTLFSDYKVAGKAEQVSALKVQVPGTAPNPSEIDLTTSKIVGNTQVNLKLPQTISTNKEVHLIFNLLDNSNNQPVQDLQNYLGEKGHLIILKKSSALTEADYIHAHAMNNTRANEIHFMATFPQPGKYKMWGQFNRNGKIITADFWIDVK
ncbi:MAG: hypothetical protein VKN72_17590 [Nostocales cyanobacterium 94392]|nr:hypothetical protein [Nostocales cyanobacterium 94392]